jgi:hypothetical protein
MINASATLPAPRFPAAAASLGVAVRLGQVRKFTYLELLRLRWTKMSHQAKIGAGA